MFFRAFRPFAAASARLAAALFLAASVAACGIPGPDATDEQVAQIRSVVYEAGGEQDYGMHARIAGDPTGLRVIFIHGTPGGVRGWADFLVDVPPGLEYVAVDRAGFGESGPWLAVPSLREQAAAIAPLLVERNGRWPILVGHSLGGPIAAQLAVDYPEQVGGLVMVAASMDPALERVELIQYVARYMGLEFLIPRRIRNANRELMELKPHLQALEPRLGDIRCPVVIVHGTADPLVPYSNVEYMRNHMVNAQITVRRLDGRNHFLPWHSKPAIDGAISSAAEADSRNCRA